MRKIVLSAAIAAVVGAGSLIAGAAEAAPAGPLAVPGLNLVEKTQFVFGGRNYCFYTNGWRGPGWYRCGYGSRRGYGWGGPAGWHGWRHDGYRGDDRRYHRDARPYRDRDHDRSYRRYRGDRDWRYDR